MVASFGITQTTASKIKPVKANATRIKKRLMTCTVYANMTSGSYYMICPNQHPSHTDDEITAPDSGWEPVTTVDTPGGAQSGPFYGDPKQPADGNHCPPRQTCYSTPVKP